MDQTPHISIPLWALIAYIVYMCAVQALPRPSQNSVPWYVFLYRFMHGLALNLALIVDPKKRMPATDPNSNPASEGSGVQL
jgi:hypothetical protein